MVTRLSSELRKIKAVRKRSGTPPQLMLPRHNLLCPRGERAKGEKERSGLLLVMMTEVGGTS